MIEKRFPADTTLTYNTFLNDKKINGELYALFQTLSFSYEKDGEYITIVKKKDLPTQSEICRILRIKSPKTFRVHLQYLIEHEYILQDDNGNYILPNKEDIYIKIPLTTLQYLKDNCREHVIKLYIYLGQRYKFAQSQNKQYEFTLEELGEHIGIKVKDYSNGYSVIKNALDLLYNSGLIDFVSYYDGKMPKKKITHFNLSYKTNDK